MPSLILNSLEIQNFRAFRHLTIKQLGRVNLIVGKNSVGKSSLLEALRIYAGRNHYAIWKLLSERDEGQYPEQSEREQIQSKLETIKYLFHGRQSLNEVRLPAQIGEVKSRVKSVSIEFGWSGKDIDDYRTPEDERPEIRPKLTIRVGNHEPIIDRFHTGLPIASDIESINCTSIPVHGLSRSDVDLLWSRIALTQNEQRIVDALNIITSRVERVSIISNPELSMARTPVVKLKDSDFPIPLQSLGDGMNRLFYIALALVNSRNGLLLIDEVGSGLHYSIQHELWRLVFTLASRLNVQVFATTHSNDCILAFQIAAQENKDEEGMLIRLEKRGNELYLYCLTKSVWQLLHVKI